MADRMRFLGQLLAGPLLMSLLAISCGEGDAAPAALAVLPADAATQPTIGAASDAAQGPSAEVPSPTLPLATPTATPAPAVKTIVLDPGHGGPDNVGAASNGVVEKNSNLDMALRVERILKERGFNVVLTRRADTRPEGYAAAASLGGFSASRLDLQARVDLANNVKADLFLSIHSNGSTNAGERGLEVWYDPNRAFGSRNLALAGLLRSEVLAALRGYGYAAVDRGLKDDSCFREFDGRCFPLFVLGQPRETTRDEVTRRGGDPVALGFAPRQNSIQTRGTQMPGALVELLFISNQSDNQVLRDDGAREAMARGVAAAVSKFLE